jgi:hypothetical protein
VVGWKRKKRRLRASTETFDTPPSFLLPREAGVWGYFVCSRSPTFLRTEPKIGP